MKEFRFKQTDAGLIPEDWCTKKIKQIAPLQRGFDLPTHLLVTGKIPVVYSNGIGAFHVNGKCHAPGLVTGRSGTIGKFTFIETGDYWPHNTTLWVTSFNFAYPKYVYYLYQTLKFEENQAGSGVPTLNRNEIHDKYICLPDISEQQRIVKVLENTDNLITSLERLIEKKRMIKQGSMQQLLTGKLRLSKFDRPWVTTTLGQVGSFTKGKGISRSETGTGEIPCIRYGEIYTTHNDYIKDFYSFISEEIAQKSVLLKKGQILFTASGETKEDIGKAVAFNLDVKAYAGGDIIILTPKVECNPVFMGYLMNSQNVVNQKASVAQGDAVVHIRIEALKDIEISIPEVKEQQAIAQILMDMDAEISALEKKLNKYKDIKSGMMQQLLTGKIRLL